MAEARFMNIEHVQILMERFPTKFNFVVHTLNGNYKQIKFLTTKELCEAIFENFPEECREVMNRKLFEEKKSD